MARFMNQDEMLRAAADYDRVTAERDVALQALRDLIDAYEWTLRQPTNTIPDALHAPLIRARALVGDTAEPLAEVTP